MFIDILATAAAAAEAPQTSFGFVQAIRDGGPVTWSLLFVLGIQSVGSFYILITKWIEQNKVLKQFQTGRSAFWRANSLA
jgi:biopolymer transport protein ExbB